MTLRLRALALGILGLIASQAHAEEPITLYERFRLHTEQNMMLDRNWRTWVELPVQRFVSALPLPYVQSLDPSDVEGLVRDELSVCSQKNINIFSECPELQQTAELVTKRTARTRELGRRLQSIASSFEEPILGSFTASATTRLLGIMRMWAADTGDGTSVETRISRISAIALEPDEGRAAAVQNLGTRLNSLIERYGEGEEDQEGEEGQEDEEEEGRTDTTQLARVVWEYRFGGVQWHEDHRRPSVTEREMEVEAALKAILQRVLAQVDVNAVHDREILMLKFPETEQALLPDNVRVWAYVERKEQVRGDVGLEWIYTIDPVQPKLCEENGGTTCTPILAGQYPRPAPSTPPNPLCDYPFMRSGGLCEEMAVEDPNACEAPEEQNDGAIALTTCVDRSSIRETFIGGDVCGGGTWHRPPSPPAEADPRQRCRIEVTCGNNPFNAITKDKDATGKTMIIMKEQQEGVPAHNLIHEYTHGLQTCLVSPPADPYAGMAKPSQERVDTCCHFEGDAYRAQCEAMASDGIFTFRSTLPDGTPLNAETCTDIMTESSCFIREIKPYGGTTGACPWTFTYTQPRDRVLQSALAIIDTSEDWLADFNNRHGPAERIPTTCSALLAQEKAGRGDPRIAAYKRAIEESGYEECTPLRLTEYASTIGNHICFLNRCLTQSRLRNRLEPSQQPRRPGTMPFVEDLCPRPDPQIGAVTAAVRMYNPWTPPPYRLGLLLQHLEELLCPGLPPGNPLCRFNPSRRFDLTPQPNDMLALGGDIREQVAEFHAQGESLRVLGEAIGMRIGTSLYSAFLSEGAIALRDFALSADALLSQFRSAAFPTTLCPIDAQGRVELCTSHLGDSSSSSTSSSAFTSSSQP